MAGIFTIVFLCVGGEMSPIEIKEKLEQLRIKRQETLYEMARKSPSGGGGGTSYVDADHIHGSSGVTALEMFEAYDKITIEMNELRKELREYSDTFDNLADKIFFLVNVYGMTQKETADYLDYNYDYIRQVYSKNSQNNSQF